MDALSALVYSGGSRDHRPRPLDHESTGVKFIRIDRASCKRCGDKAALVVRGRAYPLPVTLDAAIVEATPWVCACRRKVQLDVVMVE